MLTIGAFSKISNVTANTLRYYDEIGLLHPAYVSRETGYRFYETTQLKTVLLIGKLKLYGCSLEEIAQIVGAPGDTETLLSLIRSKRMQMREQLRMQSDALAWLENDITRLERGIGIMAYLDEIEVKLVTPAPQNVLSIRQKINVVDYGKYIGALMERINSERFTVTGAPMSIYHDEEYTPENYDTEVAIPVKEVREGTRTFEPGLCAVATLRGPYTGLTSLYARLKEWVDTEGYGLSGSPFEVYLTNPAEVPPEQFITEVCFPVKK